MANDSDDIEVPEAMLDAAVEGLRVAWGYRKEEWESSSYQGHRNIARIAIKAALLWQRNNPQVPTEERTAELLKLWGDPQGYATTTWKHVFVDVMRGMYRKPDPSPLVIYIMRHFEDIEDDNQTLRNRAEAAAKDFEEHVRRNK